METSNATNNSIDYNRINLYFTQGFGKILLKITLFFAIVGILCVVLKEFAVGVLCVFISLVLMWAAAKVMKKQPTDEEVDNAAMSQLASLKERALNKLGIDEEEVKEIPPMIFHGYEYSVLKPGINLALGATLFKFGKDNRLRTNQYRVVMFFFSSNELYCYTYNFSLTEDSKKESTDTYFYKDIVSVSTETETATFLQIQKYDYENFKLTTTGGTSISCSIREDEVEDAQRSIKGMRSLIKEKKSV